MNAEDIINLRKYQNEISQLTTEINSLEPKKEEQSQNFPETKIKISSRVYIIISIVIVIISIILLIYNKPFFVIKQVDIDGTRVIKNFELDYTKISVVILLEIILLFYIFNVL